MSENIMTITSKIEKIENLFHAKGCSEEQIKYAEQALAITFPDEFILYVKKYGAISFYATEWTGLNVGERINVVNATQKERELNPDFPIDCFVLENQSIDGIVVAADSYGRVYSVQNERKNLLCSSISEYLDQCVERKNN